MCGYFILHNKNNNNMIMIGEVIFHLILLFSQHRGCIPRERFWEDISL